MFRREPEKIETRTEMPAEPEPVVTSERPPATDAAPRSVSYIGPTVHFKGEIAAHESLIIEGEFEGIVRQHSKNFTVGKQGRVHGEIHAKTVDVRGRVEGDVYGEELVHLFSTATVIGTLNCERILMDDGADFNGTVDMTGEIAKPAKTKLTIAENDEKIAKVAS